MTVMATVGEAQVRIVADARGFARDVERQVGRAIRGIDVDRETTRTFTRAANTATSTFGGIMVSGMRIQGLAVAAALAVIIPAMIPIGAAAAAALLGAFGAGVAGLGLFFAAQNQDVQNEFIGLFRSLATSMRAISRPFIASLLAVADIIEDVFAPFRVAFRVAFQDLAPAITQFAAQVGQAFIALAPTIIPITDAFIELLEELGPELAENVFPALADAIIALAETIGANADIFASILAFFLRIPEFVIEALIFLASIATWFAEHPAAMEIAIVALTVVLGALLTAIVTLSFVLLAGIGTVGLFVAAIGGLIAGLTAAFFLFRDELTNVWNSVVGIISVATARIGNFFGNIGEGVADLAADIGRGVGNIVGFFRDLPGRVSRAVRGAFDGVWQAFRDAVNRIIRGWNSLSLTLGGGSFDPLGRFGPTISVPSFTISTPNIPRLQRGGIIEQAGMVTVGEGGPETLFLPTGAAVSPLPPTPSQPMEFTGELFLDSGEFLGIVRGLVGGELRRVTVGARANARALA